jgi:hypothetical protein
MVDYSKNDKSDYISCDRFEYFGSYFGNRGIIHARMVVTGRSAEWGSAGEGRNAKGGTILLTPAK